MRFFLLVDDRIGIKRWIDRSADWFSDEGQDGDRVNVERKTRVVMIGDGVIVSPSPVCSCEVTITYGFFLVTLGMRRRSQVRSGLVVVRFLFVKTATFCLFPYSRSSAKD